MARARNKVMPDLPDIEYTGENKAFSGSHNLPKYINKETGEFDVSKVKYKRDNLERNEAYRTWMKVKGAKKAFIAAFSECGHIVIACNAVGVHPTTVHNWLRTDDDFAADFDTAVDYAVATLEYEARRRALSGSDRLLEFLLKSLRPEVYRERYEIKQEVTADYVIDISPQKDVTPPAIDVTPTDVS